MFLRCRALNDRRRRVVSALSPLRAGPAVVAPCCPKRMVFTTLPTFATTTCDLVRWCGVRRGRLYAVAPTRSSRGSDIDAQLAVVPRGVGLFSSSCGTKQGDEATEFDDPRVDGAFDAWMEDETE